MSDGELKKQIHIVSNTHLGRGDPTREALLKSIVDEAKKDLLKDCVTFDLTVDSDFPQKFKGIPEDKWNKWFGDTK